jgi:hypothetical protein
MNPTGKANPIDNFAQKEAAKMEDTQPKKLLPWEKPKL